jgi:hypothetical protein
METTVRLHSPGYSEARTYLFALLFVGGNVALPQLCHLVPGGGLTWLPIYFFTLLAGYKFGWQVGLLTAVLSPLANSLLFAMPAMGALPLITVKSGALAVAAACAARWSGRIAWLPVVLAVVAGQAAGLLVDGAWRGFPVAVEAARVAVPGILLQVFGGYALLKLSARW